jgi:hypothetical protein
MLAVQMANLAVAPARIALLHAFRTTDALSAAVSGPIDRSIGCRF